MNQDNVTNNLSKKSDEYLRYYIDHADQFSKEVVQGAARELEQREGSESSWKNYFCDDTYIKPDIISVVGVYLPGFCRNNKTINSNYNYAGFF